MTPSEPQRIPFAALDDTTVFENLRQPLILEGAGAAWPLAQHIAAQGDAVRALEMLIGEEGVRWTSVPRDDPNAPMRFGYDDAGTAANFHVETHAGPFSEFVADLNAAVTTSTKVAYLQAMPLRELPALVAQLAAFEFQWRHVEITTGLWVGSGGHVSQLHYDFFHNFLCVLEGEKHVWLHPFETLEALRPGPYDTGPGETPGSLRVWNGDLAGAPDLSDLAPTSTLARLRANDLLYIPPFYWHAVASYGRNVMINSWTATGVPEGFLEFTPFLDALVCAANDASDADRAAFVGAANADRLFDDDTLPPAFAPLAFAPIVERMGALVEAAEKDCDRATLRNALTTLSAFYGDARAGQSAAVPLALLERAKARLAAPPPHSANDDDRPAR